MINTKIKVVKASESNTVTNYGNYTYDISLLDNEEIMQIRNSGRIGFDMDGETILKQVMKAPYNFIENSPCAYFPVTSGITSMGGNADEFRSFDGTNTSESFLKILAAQRSFFEYMANGTYSILGNSVRRVVYPMTGEEIPHVFYFLELKLRERIVKAPTKVTKTAASYSNKQLLTLENMYANSIYVHAIATRQWHVKDNEHDGDWWNTAGYRHVDFGTYTKEVDYNSPYGGEFGTADWLQAAKKFKSDGDSAREGYFAGFETIQEKLSMIDVGFHKRAAQMEFDLAGGNEDYKNFTYYLQLPLSMATTTDFSGESISDDEIFAVNEAIANLERLFNFSIVGDSALFEFYNIDFDITRTAKVMPSSIPKEGGGTYQITRQLPVINNSNFNQKAYTKVMPIDTFIVTSVYDPMIDVWSDIVLSTSDPDLSDQDGEQYIDDTITSAESDGENLPWYLWGGLIIGWIQKYAIYIGLIVLVWLYWLFKAGDKKQKIKDRGE